MFSHKTFPITHIFLSKYMTWINKLCFGMYLHNDLLSNSTQHLFTLVSGRESDEESLHSHGKTL